MKEKSFIEKALASKHCFFVMRCPDGSIHYGENKTFRKGFTNDGFLIVPFDKNPDGIISIEPSEQYSFTSQNSDISDSNLFYPFPTHSTSKETHKKEVLNIIDSIKDIEGSKVVAAKVTINQKNINIYATYEHLSTKYKDACVFIFYTPPTGMWIGATPETLLKVSDKKLTTMSLAGTRLANDSSEWDVKNIREQNTVTDFIVKILRENNLNPEISEKYNRKAGHLEHLCNDITSILEEECTSDTLQTISLQLSPTPALCGFPREKAKDIIEKGEDFIRAYYGGFFGYIRNNKTDNNQIQECNFFVNLRSAQILGNKVAVYAGGGINSLSNPDKEWEETEQKSKTILDNIISEDN